MTLCDLGGTKGTTFSNSRLSQTCLVGERKFYPVRFRPELKKLQHVKLRSVLLCQLAISNLSASRCARRPSVNVHVLLSSRYRIEAPLEDVVQMSADYLSCSVGASVTALEMLYGYVPMSVASC